MRNESAATTATAAEGEKRKRRRRRRELRRCRRTGDEGAGEWVDGTWARLHSITHSIDVDYRQNTSIRQHLTMTSARVYVCVRVRANRWVADRARVGARRGSTGGMKSRRTGIRYTVLFISYVRSRDGKMSLAIRDKTETGKWILLNKVMYFML